MTDTAPAEVQVSSLQDFESIFGTHVHFQLAEGETCLACNRPIPKIKSDDPTGSRRSVVGISEPKGEEGTLESLMIAVVDKYQDQWPRQYAEMREGIGLEVVGGKSWKYYCVHFALYAALMVPGLEPVEEG
jgi:hypothetical protein